MMNNNEQLIRQELDSVIDESYRLYFDEIVDFMLDQNDFNVKQLRNNVIWYYRLYAIHKTRQIKHLNNPFK